MRLDRFRIFNHKSFLDTRELSLSPQMNIIVGQNNVGKTALLKALSHRFTLNPHRDSSSTRWQVPSKFSFLEVGFNLTGKELKNALVSGGSRQLRLPAPINWEHNPTNKLNEFFSRDVIGLSARYVCSDEVSEWRNNSDIISELDDTVFYTHNAVLSINAQINSIEMSGVIPGYVDNVSQSVAQILKDRTYYFDSHRIVQSFCPFGYGYRLNPDASNLAEVLNAFQSNVVRYRDYVKLVSRVLPTVKWISVVPYKNISNHVEIMVWNVEPETGRDDLANALSECGTGVGQVLAILYVIVQSVGDIIIIDEPNSFLHPGAAKLLIEIMRESIQHQFIISTHAPELVTAAQPEKLLLLRFENEQTAIIEANKQNIEDARLVLNELGSRLSDVFGYDKVLWVEGPTEVQCIPLLMKLMGHVFSTKLTVAQLANPDDLSGKNSQVLAKLYKNITEINAIIPEPIAILFDGDKRGGGRLAALERSFPGLIHYLDRWTYENYLLDVEAIAEVFNTLPACLDTPISQNDVKQWILKNGCLEKYNAASYVALSEEWIVSVNGGKLLEDLFQELSRDMCGAVEIYRKTQHSVELTQWLIAHKPNLLEPITRVIDDILLA